MSRSHPGFAYHWSAIDGDRYSNDYDRSELCSQTLSKSVIMSRQGYSCDGSDIRRERATGSLDLGSGKEIRLRLAALRLLIHSPHISFHCQQFLFLINKAF